MKKRFIIFYVATFFIVVGLSFAMPASSAILFYEDFEDALNFDNPKEWAKSGEHGSQGLTTEQIRHGSKSYKFSLTRYNSGDYREEIVLHAGFNNGSLNFTIGDEYWVGFSVFLATGYYSNSWVLHHQYHGSPDSPPTCDPSEPSRNPIFRVAATKEGDFYTNYIWDSRQCTPAIGDYEGGYTGYYGAPPVGQWIDFVINVKWHYGASGFLKIWKSGVLVTDRTGGNCFNDDIGPYLKIGIYGALEQDQTITVYYDELRIGDSSSSYAEVAPGGCILPTVTTQAVTDITTTTAIGHGTITNTGGENATKRGICWNTTGTPTVADDKVEEVGNFSTGAFSGNMTGLTPDQAYFARTYAYNTGGYGYSSTTEGFDTDADANGTYIIDNGDNGTSSTGTWSASGGANPYGSGSLYCHAVNSTYTYEKTLDGNYTVSLWWTEYASRSSSVTVKIYDSGDNLLDTKSVNQTTLGGQWNEQDTYDFNATAKVMILSTGGGPPNVSTCADAVKFDYVEGSGGEDINNLSRLYGINLQGCGIN